MPELEPTKGEFLCIVTLLAIVLKFNAFRRILACSYATLRLTLEDPVPFLINSKTIILKKGGRKVKNETDMHRFKE
jgi:hypothetical protein